MIKQAVYLHYLAALLDGDKATCVHIVDNLVDEETDIKEIYIDLIQKSMYRVGHLWERSRVSVATEHIATKITENILSMLYPVVFSTPKTGKSAVVTCIDKEFHELGARIVSDYLEYKGLSTYFLGANIPPHELINLIEIKRPDVVGISANLYINVMRALKIIEDIKEKFPEQKIIVGGQAFNSDYSDELRSYKNCTYLPSLDDIDRYVKDLS